MISGMGADARLFDGQRAAFPRLCVPNWLPPLRRESLADYARRMADAVRTSEPFALGGVSFGGMVALEMARWLRPAAVFLISSCRGGRQVPRWLRWAERLSRPFPDCFADAARAFAPLVRSRSSRLDAARRRLLCAMLRDTPTRFLRWSARASVEWSFEGRPNAPVFQIHGGRDWVIPPGGMAVDRLIPDAGHLAVMTHADEVNAWIAGRLNGLRAEPKR